VIGYEDGLPLKSLISVENVGTLFNEPSNLQNKVKKGPSFGIGVSQRFTLRLIRFHFFIFL